ncbi:FAD-binding protein [Pseudodesulfovibrio sp. JC047]|uniref:FAD-binding and (Fe-S)-binding domain-containing protein n=1 Tax=Pseudodesulfovibrio sp. JC047 TaxID=2683199 RepID=UPI0013D58C6A|nr:FAD-binding and (Fe-S)-binding domain-containing protein [Pseudodesulfovibrio sp. JC047]NDV19048.1 FAD-binding protein [Pseudodesulfovibrio sp. JC047]
MLTLIHEMQSILSKECVHDNPALVDTYAVDASFYKPKAKLVVDAHSVNEVSQILDVCTRHDIGVTFRGSGTAVSGQTCGEGVIVRLHGSAWDAIRVLDEGKQFWAGCGVIGSDVNVALAPFKQKMGADPASIASATMGGIIADNSAGMCCMVEQNSYHAIKGIRMVLADGTYLDTTDEMSCAAFRKSHAKTLEKLGAMRTKILAEPEVVARIKRKYSIKNTIGYMVNSFVDHEDPMDILLHLMVGSEGTLGFIHEVLMDTIPTPPVRATGLMFFPSLKDATDAVIELKGSCNAEAAEVMDCISLRALQDVKDAPSILKELPDGACAVLIETKAWDTDGLEKNTSEILKALGHYPALIPHAFTSEDAECERLWNVRRGLFSAIASYREPDEYVLTEDINIPVPELADGCDAFQELFDRYGYNAGIMGHAFHGNLHFSIPVKIADEEAVKRLDNFMIDLVDLITKRFDGSLKAEHGTGRAMAPFVRNEWGDFLFEIMCDIKKLFDPKGILNPGVLINEDKQAYLEGLKNPVATHPSVDMCVECGFCELACPSRKIALSPRQRITLARSIAKLRMEGDTQKADEWETIFHKYGADLCATDGLCQLRCPLGADVATMVRDYRGRNASGKVIRLADYVSHHFGGVLKTATMALNGMSLAQRIIGDKALGKMATSARSLSGNKLPQWNPAMPKGGSKAPVQTRPDANKDCVVYFPSCAVRSMGPSKGDDSEPLMDVTVKLLKRAGYQVIFPQNMSKLCCGKAMETKGLAEQADAMSAELNVALLEASQNGKFMVLCDTSPCLARMKKTLDTRMTLMDPIEFAMKNVVNRLHVTKLPRTVALHPTCTTRSMGLADMFTELASKCAEKVIVPKGINCCGFAGDKGFHNPELNAAALSGLREQIVECDEGYSVSRTCEIGLTLHGGKNYRNILYLVEEATR